MRINKVIMPIADFVKRNWLVLLICVLASLFRLMLSRSMGVSYIHDSVYDDRMMYDKAISILQGDWLGMYGSMTLVKGVGYPLLAAAFSALHIPYSLGFHLLYVFACVLFMAAIAPWVKNKWIAMGAYLFLLYCPVAFAWAISRLYRDIGSYTVVLFFISCTLGFFVRLSSLKRALPWAGFAGATLAFANMYREDSQWLTVYLVICIAVCIVFWLCLYTSGDERKRWYRIICLPLVAVLGWGICVTPVLLMNGKYYGTYVLEDFNSGAFAEAYQAIYKIDAGEDSPKTVMSVEKCNQLRAVSPAFAEVADFILHDIGGIWYDTGYFTFALRTAVKNAGYYVDAKTTDQFYERMATEINQAVTEGKLLAGVSGIGISPKYYGWMTLPILEATFSGFYYLLSCTNIDTFSPSVVEINDAAEIDHYMNYTHEPLYTDILYSDGTVVSVQNMQTQWDVWGQMVSKTTVQIYKIILPILFALYLLSMAGTTILALRHNKEKNYMYGWIF